MNEPEAPSLDFFSTPYINLRTFRRNGRAVDTPVWVAPGPNHQGYIFSAGEAGKIKRLRLSDEAEVAKCDMRGRVLGPWLPARAQLVSSTDCVNEALSAMRKKYGWQMALADIGARLTGRFNTRAYIELSLL